MDEALQDMKDNMPLPNGKSFDSHAFLNDSEAFDYLMDGISSGNSVRQMCAGLSLPTTANIKLTRDLARLKAPDPRFDVYMAAKRARAHQFADQLLDVTTKVELEVMTVQQGAMVTKTLMWLAERLDPGQWSGRIQVDANIKMDTATQHLAAVRELATMVLNDNPGNVVQGDVIDVTQEEGADLLT